MLRADARRRRGGRRAGRRMARVRCAGPRLAAAEDQHAALQLQGVLAFQLDAGAVVAAVLRIVALPLPLVVLLRLHREQDRGAEQRASAPVGVGIVLVDAGLALPRDAAP